ncbi:MAG: sodium:solute symporter [Longimicrobiales bacterium]|nr:sodium:solute symporter [Longimicrobiales bacterium]
MTSVTVLDFAVIVAYLVGVTIWGAWLGRGQTGGTDYFLGNRELPWGAVMLSVVATETSTLTFLSIPGVAYLGTLTFLQLTVGYLVGRIVVSLLLLPAYYRGELTTAYALLETRFGVATRRFCSAIFMVTRLLADSVRLFATAIPLALVTGWPYPLSIAVIGAMTLVYTYFGGIKAVVWVDALQMALYLVGAVVAAMVLQALIPGGWGEVFALSREAGKLAVVDFQFTLSVPYTFWAGLLGGGFLTMGSHGADQLIVQRLLTCKDLKASQKALVWSAVVVMAQFLVFLLVGLGLWVFYGGVGFDRSDEIFARFIVEELPPGITGLLIAGIFAAAMSSLSSSINSLASASAYDFWAPLRGIVGDEARILRVGKGFTLLWAALLIGGAVLFIPLSTRTSAVEVALGIASVVYGGLLGAFALGILADRADQRSTMTGMATGIGVVMVIWLTVPDRVAWPWFVLIGTMVTFSVGWALGRNRVA